MFQVVEGLDFIGTTADGQQTAFLQLHLSGSDLSTAYAFAPYIHLQTLTLANNKLRNVKVRPCTLYLMNFYQKKLHLFLLSHM